MCPDTCGRPSKVTINLANGKGPRSVIGLKKKWN